MFWWGYLRERDRLEDVGIDGRIILKWTTRTVRGGRRLDSLWLRKASCGWLL